MSELEELPVHWQRWYHEWDENVPDNDMKRRLRGELLERDDRKAYSAAFELYLFSLFRSLGLNVEFQPTINGANADFLVTAKSQGLSQYAFVEAGVMYSDPLEELMENQVREDRIWEDFMKIKSDDFYVDTVQSSGNPGNVRSKSVRNTVQKWLDSQDVTKLYDGQNKEYWLYSRLGMLPRKTFEFSGWKLEVGLRLKSNQEKEQWGSSAVRPLFAGSSGFWSDNPADRLKSKLDQKFSQVRKTGKNCIVAITERMSWPSDGDVQQALWGANSGCFIDPNSDLLEVPQIKSDGLWSRPDVTQPMAVLVHSGNLRNGKSGESAVWLNPNCNYFNIPLSLLSLKVCAAEQKIWVKPASH